MDIALVGDRLLKVDSPLADNNWVPETEMEGLQVEESQSRRRRIDPFLVLVGADDLDLDHD